MSHIDDDTDIRAAASDAWRARLHLLAVIAAQCPGLHHYVQHRDGQPPWCPTCRYTRDGRRLEES